MRTIEARYRGRCSVTGAVINPGDIIRMAGRGRPVLVSAGGAYLAAPGRVDVIRIGDKTFTRNARGLCEDAPCCGCCTI